MVLKVVDMRHSAQTQTAAEALPTNGGGRQPMASPAQARSVVACYLAAGARPDEIDGAVQVQVELEAKAAAPTTYEEIANSPIRALAEYRRRQQTFTVVEEG